MGPERWVKSGFSYSFWTLGLARTESQSNLDCNLKKNHDFLRFYFTILYNFLRFFHVFFIFHVFFNFSRFFSRFFYNFFRDSSMIFFPDFCYDFFHDFFHDFFTILTTIFFFMIFFVKKDLLNFYWIVHDFLQVKFVKIKDFVLPFF